MRYEKKVKSHSFYFHDYETFGTDPQTSQCTQFAGIRTDENLNIIDGSELNIFCYPREDQLPSPMACLVTHMTPQRILKQDPKVIFNEYDFARIIEKEMSIPNTCNIGYNSISFDDECTRNVLYRNFFNPYNREFKNGCSRADGLNIIMLVSILNPNIINFPYSKDKDGNVLKDNYGNHLLSFKLEELSKSNGIIHENAHDALSDVRALIGIMKIIKDNDPELWDYAINLRFKKNVSELLKEFTDSDKPFLHASSFYGKVNNNFSVVKKIGFDRVNANKIYVFDLLCNPEILLSSAEEIKKNLFSKSEELTEMNAERAGIKNIVINKMPMLCGLNKIKERAKEMGLVEKSELIKTNLQKLKKIESEINIQEKLDIIFTTNFPPQTDVDCMIYSGFASGCDSNMIGKVHACLNNNFDFSQIRFEEGKYSVLLERFIMRNFPHLASPEIVSNWNNYINYKLFNENSNAEYNVFRFKEEMDRVSKEFVNDSDKMILINELYEYFESRFPNYKIR